jgi:hypothetical protein
MADESPACDDDASADACLGFDTVDSDCDCESSDSVSVIELIDQIFLVP